MRVILGIVLLSWVTGCGYEETVVDLVPTGLGAEEPSLVVSDNGLLMSWMEPYEGDILFKMATHDGSKWSEAKAIAKGDNWFVNWADYPAMVVNGSKIFAHFLQIEESPALAYNIMYLVSEDMGETWTKPIKLHQDTAIAEHGFVSAVPFKDGFYVTWLDGRNTVGNKGKFTLRGVYVDSNGDLDESTEIDDDTCTCCQTTMAIVDDVPYSFFRNRTEEEIRDVYYSRYEDDTWTVPVTLNDDNWHIPGCPVNGPVAKSYGNTMAVAWFTGADGKNNVMLKISNDKGATFDEAILVEGPKTLGRVDVQMDSAHVYVTYLSNNKEGAAISLKKYNFEGDLLSSEVLVMVSPARGTGFPKTAIWKDNLVIAWTDVDANTIKIITHSLNNDTFTPNSGLQSGR